MNSNDLKLQSDRDADSEEKDKAIYSSILEFSRQNTKSYDNSKFLKNIIDRKNNAKIFGFNDHIRALIYSQLSNQTKWINIEPKLPQIDRLFFDFNKRKILEMPADYFYNRIFNLKCGNIATKKQMESLKENIVMIEKIEYENGGLDNYFTKSPAVIIAKDLSNGKYKLKYVGYALAWEYLRNIGIDGAKPDTHMKRILGTDRLGYSNSPIASDDDVYRAVSRISASNDGALHTEIDLLLWNFCASGYGEICTAEPNCHLCPIKMFCNKR